MFHFFLAFIYALVVYDAGPPPVVGVGTDVNTAQKHIDFLKRYHNLSWETARRTTNGILFQIKDDYTVCQSVQNEKT